MLLKLQLCQAAAAKKFDFSLQLMQVMTVSRCTAASNHCFTVHSEAPDAPPTLVGFCCPPRLPICIKLSNSIFTTTGLTISSSGYQKLHVLFSFYLHTENFGTKWLFVSRLKILDLDCSLESEHLSDSNQSTRASL